MKVEEQLASLLVENKRTVALAESITGGLVSHRITNIPGSSRYFVGTVVAYSYESKVALLGVRRDTLEKYGAVSEETAREMASGVRRIMGTDIGAAVTGIAGPGGATASKPIGLACFAVDLGSSPMGEAKHFQGGREEIKQQASSYLLEMIVRELRLKINVEK